MTDVVCDASIVVKWFHDQGEAEVDAARRLLVAHRAGRISAWLLDLTLYELGSVLVRVFRWPGSEVADQLDDVRSVCPVLVPGGRELRLAAQLAEEHGLSFYGAAYAAAAASRGAALATFDRALLAAAGVGESPSTIVDRLDL